VRVCPLPTAVTERGYDNNTDQRTVSNANTRANQPTLRHTTVKPTPSTAIR